jgi:hypothetical protein
MGGFWEHCGAVHFYGRSKKSLSICELKKNFNCATLSGIGKICRSSLIDKFRRGVTSQFQFPDNWADELARRRSKSNKGTALRIKSIPE